MNVNDEFGISEVDDELAFMASLGLVEFGIFDYDSDEPYLVTTQLDTLQSALWDANEEGRDVYWLFRGAEVEYQD